jgi:hypothetical protein
VKPFAELLADCQHSAVHLEMRDQYAIAKEDEEFASWQRGERVDWTDRSAWWTPFYQAISDAVERGVGVRRARIVSEPVTEYIHWEHYVTRGNVEAGELVRWLPRRQASDLALPGNDFWLFDGRSVRLHHFSGAGDLVEHEITDSQDVAKLCGESFEQVWARAVPHAEYEIS